MTSLLWLSGVSVLDSSVSSLFLFFQYLVNGPRSLCQEFLQHINCVDPSIQFTTEEAKQDGSMPFLDTLVTPQEEFIESPPTLIYTFSGAAITTWLAHIV